MKHLFIVFILIAFWNNRSYCQIFPRTKYSFVVIAHRGDHTKAPENTLKSYQNAIDNGVDYIEVDLRTSKDSQLVVMHNESVDAMTNGTGKVKQLTLQELKQLIVLDKNHPGFGTENIPTFEEVLQLALGKVNIYLDFKNASVEDTWKMIVSHHMENNFIVYANTPMQLINWKQQHPDIPVMTSIPDNIRTISKFQELASKFRFDIIDGDADDYSRTFVKKVQKMKKQLWIDAQSIDESEKTWESIIHKGIHAIQTDHPEALIKYLKDHKIR